MQIRPNDWAWDWLNDEVVRLGSPVGDTVVQIPVRGNADVAMETSLVTTKVLTPYQILRARALDSDHPVFSEFRCNLWKDAYANFKASPPDFGDATRNPHNDAKRRHGKRDAAAKRSERRRAREWQLRDRWILRWRCRHPGSAH